MTINIVLEQNIELICNECGDYLDHSESKNLDAYFIEPCKSCLIREYDEGYEKGKNENV